MAMAHWNTLVGLAIAAWWVVAIVGALVIGPILRSCSIVAERQASAALLEHAEKKLRAVETVGNGGLPPNAARGPAEAA